VPRVESSLERGGASREGLGPSSEAGTLARGGAKPSGEAGTCLRGAKPSSEAEVSAPVPRAKRRFARGVPRLAI
jgi:hypothetical protein